MEMVELELNDETNDVMRGDCKMDILNVPAGDVLEDEFSEEDEGE